MATEAYRTWRQIHYPAAAASEADPPILIDHLFVAGLALPQSLELPLQLPDTFEYSKQLLRTLSKLLGTQWLSEGRLLIDCTVFEVFQARPMPNGEEEEFISVTKLKLEVVSFVAGHSPVTSPLLIPWRSLEQCVSLADVSHPLWL